jgi:hypothetical protein
VHSDKRTTQDADLKEARAKFDQIKALTGWTTLAGVHSALRDNFDASGRSITQQEARAMTNTGRELISAWEAYLKECTRSKVVPEEF